MDFNRYSHIFMIGIGGIGMSALARYFRLKGKTVAGYDRTHTTLTGELENEGISIIYEDNPALVDPQFKNPENVLLIFTPAVKGDNHLLQYFTSQQFTLLKRSEVLGAIAATYKTIAIAGTHGKTTTSSMVSHLLNQTANRVNALVGGIIKNYQSNFLFSEKSDFLVTEADEFDRSFLKLRPHFAVITACDADHLDIYGTAEELIHAYEQFAELVDPDGILLIKYGIEPEIDKAPVERKFTYSLDNPNADVYARHIHVDGHQMAFDLVTPFGTLDQLVMKPTGLINIENAVAACFMALQAGADEEEIRKGLATFNGVRRRFDMHFNNGTLVYIDDYAHHPEEIKALIRSVKSIYPFKKITGIFQPHLFSRTRDFADEFALSLQSLDQVILLEIYPAREKPIEGIHSTYLLNKINHHHKVLLSMEEIPYHLLHHDFEVLLTIGAGSIETLVEPIMEMISRKTSKQEIP